jgi:hypothetical protein
MTRLYVPGYFLAALLTAAFLHLPSSVNADQGHGLNTNAESLLWDGYDVVSYFKANQAQRGLATHAIESAPRTFKLCATWSKSF